MGYGFRPFRYISNVGDEGGGGGFKTRANNVCPFLKGGVGRGRGRGGQRERERFWLQILFETMEGATGSGRFVLLFALRTAPIYFL